MKNIFFISTLFVLFSCDSGKMKSGEKYKLSTDLFEELWDVFDKNYAFFELRNVNWEAERINGLQKVCAIKNDSLLFEEFCSLLRKFDDSHINLESDHLNLYCNSGELPDFYREFPTNESFGAFLRARDKSLRRLGIYEILDSESDLFQFGINVNEEWGYVRIKRFFGQGLDKTRTELNYIFDKLKNVKNLIIDIRVNPGGNDEMALLCASYFFEHKEIAFMKSARNGKGHEDFSQFDTTYIYPNKDTRFNFEQIYLLTNRASGSSADVYALIMSYLPNLNIVGTNTEGIFSNMLRDTLSNGWRLTLSNERYFSRNMHCYEKIGIPVDIEVENKMEDIDRGIDLVIYTLVNKKSEKPAANKH